MRQVSHQIGCAPATWINGIHIARQAQTAIYISNYSHDLINSNRQGDLISFLPPLHPVTSELNGSTSESWQTVRTQNRVNFEVNPTSISNRDITIENQQIEPATRQNKRADISLVLQQGRHLTAQADLWPVIETSANKKKSDNSEFSDNAGFLHTNGNDIISLRYLVTFREQRKISQVDHKDTWTTLGGTTNGRNVPC